MSAQNSSIKLHLRVLLISLFTSLLVMGLKWWAYALSGSVALKTDALESFINIVAIVMAITAIYQAQRPADLSHPYGHGKIEYFSSAIEGGMLLFGGCFLLYESIQALLLHTKAYEIGTALLFSAASGAINGALGAWQLKKGKALQSEAIIADARHILADFYTTVGVIIGLLLTKISGYYFCDALIAAIVSLMLLRNSIKIISRSARVLSDAEDLHLIKDIVDILNSPLKPTDIIDIHLLRSFRSGKKNFIDLHVVVPEFWNVRQAHDVTEDFCAKLKDELQRDSEFHPHVEACMRKYCANCAVENCPIRQEAFKEKPVFNVGDVVAAREEDH